MGNDICPDSPQGRNMNHYNRDTTVDSEERKFNGHVQRNNQSVTTSSNLNVNDHELEMSSRFDCPICLNTMKEPVTNLAKTTYCRQCIEVKYTYILQNKWYTTNKIAYNASKNAMIFLEMVFQVFERENRNYS